MRGRGVSSSGGLSGCVSGRDRRQTLQLQCGESRGAAGRRQWRAGRGRSLRGAHAARGCGSAGAGVRVDADGGDVNRVGAGTGPREHRGERLLLRSPHRVCGRVGVISGGDGARGGGARQRGRLGALAPQPLLLLLVLLVLLQVAVAVRAAGAVVVGDASARTEAGAGAVARLAAHGGSLRRGRVVGQIAAQQLCAELLLHLEVERVALVLAVKM